MGERFAAKRAERVCVRGVAKVCAYKRSGCVVRRKACMNAWCACVQKSAGGGPEEQHRRWSSYEHSERGWQPRSWKQGAASSTSSELPVRPTHDGQSLGHGRQTQIQPQGNVPYRFKDTWSIHHCTGNSVVFLLSFIFLLAFFLELMQDTIRSLQIAIRAFLSSPVFLIDHFLFVYLLLFSYIAIRKITDTL